MLRRLFEYDAWANQEVLKAPPAGALPDRAVALAAHVIAAESLWLDRLRASPQRMAVWPALTLEQCRAAAARLARELAEYVDQLDAASVPSRRTYVNTKGETHTSSVADVLLHVLLHSAYHRGQIAMVVRGAGSEPAYTDYVHAVREGFIASPFERG
ncbi:MAG TPA: DinB family protein [Gemmatimonadales bacterium]|nr:DinB family protein [Gemmatimonadales bacterium]